MAFKFSRCLYLQVAEPTMAADFYQNVLGLEVLRREGDTVEIRAGPCHLVLAQGEARSPIMELLTPNIEAAKEELVGAGCEVILWEGHEGSCQVRDPFGFVFNLCEAPDVFWD